MVYANAGTGEGKSRCAMYLAVKAFVHNVVTEKKFYDMSAEEREKKKIVRDVCVILAPMRVIANNFFKLFG